MRWSGKLPLPPPSCWVRVRPGLLPPLGLPLFRRLIPLVARLLRGSGLAAPLRHRHGPAGPDRRRSAGPGLEFAGHAIHGMQETGAVEPARQSA